MVETRGSALRDGLSENCSRSLLRLVLAGCVSRIRFPDGYEAMRGGRGGRRSEQSRYGTPLECPPIFSARLSQAHSLLTRSEVLPGSPLQTAVSSERLGVLGPFSTWDVPSSRPMHIHRRTNAFKR